jgi:voltage-gated potassium channel
VLIDDTLGLINTIFAVDFFVRWWAAGNFKAQYLTKPLIVLDIVVVLIPLYIGVLLPVLASAGIAGPDGTLPWIPEGFEPNSAGLQNLLLLRILRLRRVLTDINTFSRFEMALGLKPQDVRPYQLQLARVLLSIFTLLSVASGLIYQAEHEVNPQIPDYFAALYFGLTTLTTVGFGDIAPITSQGRLIVCLSILAGVAVIPAQASKLVDVLVEFQQEQKKGGPRVTVRAGSAAMKAKDDNDTSKSRVSSVKLREKAAEASTDVNNIPVVVSKSSTTKKVAAQAESATNGQFEGLLGRYCLECESTDHREDATYCWNCGNKL